jgi:hypothetical protein
MDFRKLYPGTHQVHDRPRMVVSRHQIARVTRTGTLIGIRLACTPTYRIDIAYRRTHVDSSQLIEWYSHPIVELHVATVRSLHRRTDSCARLSEWQTAMGFAIVTEWVVDGADISIVRAAQNHCTAPEGLPKGSPFFQDVKARTAPLPGGLRQISTVSAS